MIRELVARHSEHLLGASAQELVQWVASTFQDRAVLTCSFGGAGGMVLAHMVSKCRPVFPLVFIDTDYLFPETYALKEKIEREWRLPVRTVRSPLSTERQAEQYGEALWQRDPDLCCALRKVWPMQQALQGVDCWVSALRRDQGATRAEVKRIELHRLDDGREILKVQPLADWSRSQVWEYIERHDIPYNPLLDDGYSSLGCVQCTSRSRGADERAGRWQNSSKTECGLHTFTTKARGN